MFEKTTTTTKPQNDSKPKADDGLKKMQGDMIISAKALPQLKGQSVEEFFQPLSCQNGSIWLDSGNSQHVDSRFDIIVWSPIATLTTKNSITDVCLYEGTCSLTELKNHGKLIQEFQSTDDPLLLVKDIQAQLFTQLEHPHDFLPFLGGALGYFSYDLGRCFEKLPLLAKQDINLPEMLVGLYNQAIIFDKITQDYYLVCQDCQRIEIENSITLLIEQINSAKSDIVSQPFELTSDWLSNMSESSYNAKFEKVQEYLLAGDCYQVNLAQRFQAEYQGDEFEAYLALKSANKAPFSAFIRLESSAILSISPERFLKLNQGKVQSKPIKGTMPRSNDEAQDRLNAQYLKQSKKDKAENLMIVDLLRNDMSRSCQAGTVKVPKLFDIESFPAVHHLVSTVEGVLADNKHATDLLRGAFPGGSITGAPKIRAMEVIEELEPHQRSVYCGSIGYISNCGTMDTSITIRTLVCQATNHTNASQNSIYCWAGGGVVADSKVESEYQETFDKVNCILPVLSKLNKD